MTPTTTTDAPVLDQLTEVYAGVSRMSLRLDNLISLASSDSLAGRPTPYTYEQRYLLGAAADALIAARKILDSAMLTIGGDEAE